MCECKNRLNQTQRASLLTRPKPHSCGLAIDPQNQVRDQESQWSHDKMQANLKIRDNSCSLMSILTNNLRAWPRNHHEGKETSGKRIMCTKIVRPAVAAKSGPNAHARGNPKPDRRTPAGKTKSQGTLLAMREIAEHVNQSDLETLGRWFLLMSGKLEPCDEQIEQPLVAKKKNETRGNSAPGVAPCEDRSLTGSNGTQLIWWKESEPKTKTQI
jgi:hypothetical protein